MTTDFVMPSNFVPDFEADFRVYGPLGRMINVQVQYVGPKPREVKQPEFFLYRIRQYGGTVENGLLAWDARNGPISLEEVGKSLALQWDTHSPML